VTDTARIHIVGTGKDILVRVERELVQVLTVIAPRLPQIKPGPELKRAGDNREQNEDEEDDFPA
jgi:hypothetical protein